MIFSDAVLSMQAGNKLIRPSMSGYYLTILYNQTYIWSIGSSNDSAVINASVYIPQVVDILATDWMIKKN